MRPKPGNLRAFIEKIAADNASIEFCHHRIELRVRQKKRHHHRSGVRRWKFLRKAVSDGDVLERFKDDAAAFLRICGYATAQLEGHCNPPRTKDARDR
jgi:hypothetical protein